MGVSFLIIALCLLFGAAAAVLSFRPNIASEVTASLRKSEPVKKFSPRNTLFIIGPDANHQACRIQRRLLKPAIPALIAEDVVVIELYGSDTPRKNGEPIDWLDPSLLRHALVAEKGFYVIYVDDDGKTRFKSEAPMVTTDIIKRAHIRIGASGKSHAGAKSKILKKLRAA